MHAVSRASHAHVPHRPYSTRLLGPVLSEIAHHKLRVLSCDSYHIVVAAYGLCGKNGIIPLTGRVAQICTDTKYNIIPPIVHETIPNLLKCLQKTLDTPNPDTLAEQIRLFHQATVQWHIRELQDQNPGLFSNYPSEPEPVITPDVAYYEMCLRIALTLARKQTSQNNLAITIPTLYYNGPLSLLGSIADNGAIKITESFSKIVTYWGTFITGNPSHVSSPAISALAARLQLTDQSVLLDLDNRRRPSALPTPSGIPDTSARWHTIRDSVLRLACRNLSHDP